MIKYKTSDAAVSGDTVRTSIGSITCPSNTRKIVGVWCYAEGAATMTNGEPITGKFDLDSGDIPIVPCELPLDPANVLTSGAYGKQIHVWPLNVAVNGKAEVTCYVTMDVAMTGELKCRFGLVLDVA